MGLARQHLCPAAAAAPCPQPSLLMWGREGPRWTLHPATPGEPREKSYSFSDQHVRPHQHRLPCCRGTRGRAGHLPLPPGETPQLGPQKQEPLERAQGLLHGTSSAASTATQEGRVLGGREGTEGTEGLGETAGQQPWAKRLQHAGTHPRTAGLAGAHTDPARACHSRAPLATSQGADPHGGTCYPGELPGGQPHRR